MRFTRFAKGFQRGKKVGMNKTEAAYDLELNYAKSKGVIIDYWYEGITLKLADATRYTPDFLVLAADGTLECHEVKAGMLDKKTKAIVPISEDASRIKLSIAAERFPFRFSLNFCYKGQWHERVIGGNEKAEEGVCQ